MTPFTRSCAVCQSPTMVRWRCTTWERLHGYIHASHLVSYSLNSTNQLLLFFTNIEMWIISHKRSVLLVWVCSQLHFKANNLTQTQKSEWFIQTCSRSNSRLLSACEWHVTLSTESLWKQKFIQHMHCVSACLEPLPVCPTDRSAGATEPKATTSIRAPPWTPGTERVDATTTAAINHCFQCIAAVKTHETHETHACTILGLFCKTSSDILEKEKCEADQLEFWSSNLRRWLPLQGQAPPPHPCESAQWVQWRGDKKLVQSDFV